MYAPHWTQERYLGEKSSLTLIDVNTQRHNIFPLQFHSPNQKSPPFSELLRKKIYLQTHDIT